MNMNNMFADQYDSLIDYNNNILCYLKLKKFETDANIYRTLCFVLFIEAK